MAGSTGIWGNFLRFTAWTVILGSAVPVGMLYAIIWLMSGNAPTGTELVGRGELVLLASGLLTGAVATLVRKYRDLPHNYANAAEALLWGTFVMTLIAAGIWGALTALAVVDREVSIKWLPTWGGLAYVLLAYLQAAVTLAVG